MTLDIDKIRAVCFDVDGTLSDTDDLYVDRLARWIKPFFSKNGKRDPRKVARRLVMAAEGPANFMMGLPDLLGLDDELDKLVDWFARHARNHPGQMKLIAGVDGMLAGLHHKYPLAVVSARDERSTRRFLNETGVEEYFQVVATALTCAHTKPFPDPILWAAREMGVPPDACLMVGDTTVDMRAGRAAGAQTAGVLCGFGERQELALSGADIILDSTSDLLTLLGKINSDLPG